MMKSSKTKTASTPQTIDCESLRKILNNNIDNYKLFSKLIKSARPTFKTGLEDLRDKESIVTNALKDFGYTQFCLSKTDVQFITKKSRI